MAFRVSNIKTDNQVVAAGGNLNGGCAFVACHVRGITVQSPSCQRFFSQETIGTYFFAVKGVYMQSSGNLQDTLFCLRY
jgi:hypothetical protein